MNTKTATQAATTTCKLHKKETALHFDQTGGAWCEQCQQRALLMDYGAANKYPEINVAGCSVWSGAGAWKVTVPRLSTMQVAIICTSLLIGAQNAPEMPEPVLEPQEVQRQGNAEKQALSTFSEPLCMKCAREGTHEDLHGRLWCADHAPKGAHLAAWFRTALEERNATPPVYRIDQRYSDCAWYDAKQHAAPVSQALDYALQRDYWYLDLDWYTPELKRLFGKYPEEAKAWVEKLAEAKRKGDRNRARYLAAEINTIQRKQEQPESLERCFLCEKETDVFDKHGRAYCLFHAPEEVVVIADLPADSPFHFSVSADGMVRQKKAQETWANFSALAQNTSVILPSLKDEETVMQEQSDLCSVNGAHGIAEYFSGETGEPICKACFERGI